MPSKRREKAEFNVRNWKGGRIFSGICLFWGGTFFRCTIYAKLQSCFVASTAFTPCSTSTRNNESMSETASTPHLKSRCAFPELLPHQQGCHTLRKTCNFSVFCPDRALFVLYRCHLLTAATSGTRFRLPMVRFSDALVLFVVADAFVARAASHSWQTHCTDIFFFFIHWWRGGDPVLLPSLQPREVFLYIFVLSQLCRPVS